MTHSIDLSTSGHLRLHFEGGRSVELPPTTAGLHCLVGILHADAFEQDRRIGTAAAPTQWQVNEWLKAWKGAKPKPEIDVDVGALL